MTGRGGRRRAALAAALLCAAGACCACDTSTPGEGPDELPPASSQPPSSQPPSSQPPSSQPPSTNPAAATALRSTVGCRGEPPRARVVLRWTPSGAGAQRVDVSVLDDGFAAGTFASSRPLPPDRAVLGWPEPGGEAMHFWRVRTRVDGRWVDSETATFTGPGCVGVDMQPGG